MQSMIPDGLRGNADVLFGNLNEIYTFHSEIFLKDLENSIRVTELVALCFVQRVSVTFLLPYGRIFFKFVPFSFTA